MKCTRLHKLVVACVFCDQELAEDNEFLIEVVSNYFRLQSFFEHSKNLSIFYLGCKPEIWKLDIVNLLVDNELYTFWNRWNIMMSANSPTHVSRWPCQCGALLHTRAADFDIDLNGLWNLTVLRFSWVELSLQVQQIDFSCTYKLITWLVLAETSSILRETFTLSFN